MNKYDEELWEARDAAWTAARSARAAVWTAWGTASAARAAVWVASTASAASAAWVASTVAADELDHQIGRVLEVLE